MPLSSELVGVVTAPVEHTVDHRWLMAYAASVGAVTPAYLDSTRPAGIVSHPVFPVCLEWPAVLAVRDHLTAAGLERAEAARSVHLTHDLRSRRPIRAGDRLRTTARIKTMEARRSGTLVMLELETIDAEDQTVCVTDMGTLYRDVAVVGDLPPTAASERPVAPTTAADVSFAIDVGAEAAHVYTECSRIWNPIHTDARTAARAGLPGIILHGTATLAMAVTQIVARSFDDDPASVTGVAARFGAMVTMPSRLEARAWTPPDGSDPVGFTVDGPTGEPVLRDGRLVGSRPC